MHDKGKKLIIFFIYRRSFSFLHINPQKKNQKIYVQSLVKKKELVLIKLKRKTQTYILSHIVLQSTLLLYSSVYLYAFQSVIFVCRIK
jgi:hypothetical protein